MRAAKAVPSGEDCMRRSEFVIVLPSVASARVAHPDLHKSTARRAGGRFSSL
jgi:hypothetical protein